jgi:hypothetical protein
METENKGPWTDVADEGIVPRPDDEDTAHVTGETTGDDTPATEEGIDLSAGDNADATADGGAPRTDDLRDAGQRSSNL